MVFTVFRVEHEAHFFKFGDLFSGFMHEGVDELLVVDAAAAPFQILCKELIAV